MRNIPVDQKPILQLIKEIISLYSQERQTYDIDGSFATLDNGTVLLLFQGDYVLAEKVKNFISENKNPGI